MKNIKEIELVFENCQTMTFKAEQIKNIHIGNISQQVNRIAANAIAMLIYSDDVMIDIEKSTPFTEDELNLLDEVSITFLILKDEDGNETTIYVPFKDEDDDSSLNQYERKLTTDRTTNIIIGDEEAIRKFDEKTEMFFEIMEDLDRRFGKEA